MAHSSPLRTLVTAVLVASTLTFGGAPSIFAQSPASPSFKELFDRSEKEGKGLMFYVKGQTIPGVVVKITADTVEVRNQTYGRIVIRLDSIDAVAIN